VDAQCNKIVPKEFRRSVASFDGHLHVANPSFESSCCRSSSSSMGTRQWDRVAIGTRQVLTQRVHVWSPTLAASRSHNRPQRVAFVTGHRRSSPSPPGRSVALRAALPSRPTRDKRNASEPNRNHLDTGQRHPCCTRSNGRRRSRSLPWHSKFPQMAATQGSRFLPRRVTSPAVHGARRQCRTPYGFLGSPSSCRYLRCCPRWPRTLSVGARSQGLTEET
jgi:hypothetical protein